MSNKITFEIGAIINYFFYLCPIFIILGPFFNNLYVILLFFFCAYYSLKNKINFKFLEYEKIFLLFLIYLFFSNLFILNYNGLIKVLYLATFFFILTTFRSIKYKNNLKSKISFFYLILFLLLLIDALFQFTFGKNIFGYDLASGARVSGVFGDEAIMGSFLSKFLIILSAILLFENKNLLDLFFKNLLLLFLILIIFLSGERVAFIYSIFFLIVYFIYQKKFKLLYIYSIIFICIITLFLKLEILNPYKVKYLNFIADLGISKTLSENYSTEKKIDEEHIKFILKHKTFHNYSDERMANQLGISKEKVSSLIEKKTNYYNFLNSYHGGLYAKTIELSKKKIFFGYGIKNYRKVCPKNNTFNKNFFYKDYVFKYHCSTHPHNIYLELLVETGLIGLLIFIYFLFIYFKNFHYDVKDKLYGALMVTNIGLFFPFMSTGSFFSSQYFIYFLFFIIFLTNYREKNGNI